MHLTKFICDQKLHGKQNVGGVKARLQNDDMDWSQKMWTHLGLGFSIVSMEAIMGGECFQLCMLCVLFGFFCFAILGNLGVLERWGGCYGKLMEQCVDENVWWKN